MLSLLTHTVVLPRLYHANISANAAETVPSTRIRTVHAHHPTSKTSYLCLSEPLSFRRMVNLILITTIGTSMLCLAKHTPKHFIVDYLDFLKIFNLLDVRMAFDAIACPSLNNLVEWSPNSCGLYADLTMTPYVSIYMYLPASCDF
jgi:hypothetical protein